MRRIVKRVLWALVLLILAAGAVLGGAAWWFLSRLERIAAAPAAAAPFHSPYFLYVPRSMPPEGLLRLLVVPNNTGTGDDDRAVHERKAWMRIYGMRALVEELGTPLLVPAFPRPSSNWQVYTHALDRDTFTTEVPELRQLDRQLLAMIDDARTRLQQRTGRAIDAQVLMSGFSANGMFVNRFAILHPERVLAVAAGSPGGWPLLPVRNWQGRPLRYPIGIDDVKELTGVEPDAAALRALSMLIFQGDADKNDSVAYGDGWDESDRNLVNELFGVDLATRLRGAEPVYRAVMPRVRFELFPGAGHQRTEAMDRAVVAFFRQALSR